MTEENNTTEISEKKERVYKTISFDSELHHKIKVRAAQEGVLISELSSKILEKYLEVPTQ